MTTHRDTEETANRIGALAGRGSGSAAPDAGGDPVLPIQVYGPEVSYFTGKLEAVLRFKELDHQRISRSPASGLARTTGVDQVPGVQLGDGRWITDTTPIIAWLDERYPEPAVIPRDPAVAFFSRLLEDYADEWLWRPAMHYRWDYAQDARHLSRFLADEVGGEVAVPRFALRFLIRNRQRALFTRGDGVTSATWDHVEMTYLDSLAQLGAILETRPYLLGTRPSLADFGFFGPMFRHFGQDPTGASLMRETAPAVYEWASRVWNARASVTGGELLSKVPDDWGPILDSIGSAYLPYLCANAEAWKAGQSHFDVDIEGAPYRRIRTARYRVWCLEELRRHFDELAEPDQLEVRARLEAHGCWEPLWRVANPASGIDPERNAPFSPGHSMTGVVPSDAYKKRWIPVGRARRSRTAPGGAQMNSYTEVMKRFSSTPTGSKMARRVGKLDPYLYRWTNGKLTVAGPQIIPQLVLTTTGRRSGRERSVQVGFIRDGSDYVVVASNFGQGHHPAWRYNLEADPNARIQVGPDKMKVTAELLDPDDKDAVWPRIIEAIPQIGEYVKRTDRTIRVFRLTPAA